MKTVTIKEAFTGYPNGKDSRAFTAGEEVEVANEFADLIIGKGLAKEVGSKTTSQTTSAEAAPEKDETK